MITWTKEVKLKGKKSLHIILPCHQSSPTEKAAVLGDTDKWWLGIIEQGSATPSQWPATGP